MSTVTEVRLKKFVHGAMFVSGSHFSNPAYGGFSKLSKFINLFCVDVFF